jgi:DNA polymerase
VASLFGEAKIADAIIPPDQRADALDRLRAEVASCTRCPALVANRTQTVFGVGNPNARLMFIGEAPGADEDRQGEPFVGRAGQLLNDMITKGMKLRREDVYIANIVKCRPPENRNPLPEEAANCLPYLERQIAIVRPEFLCLLGKVPASVLLATAMPMGRLRGKWHRYRGIPTIATWHPAYLLRKPEAKKDTWQDLQMLMNAMGIPLPGRTKPE